jgi:hypothetical protein
MSPRNSLFRVFTPALLPLALLLIVWGCKLSVINRYGSDLPYWDQWPGEGTFTFLPWLEHHDLWSPLLLPHNEHRIAPTRLLSLGLLLAGGQWDAAIQCMVNAALQAALVTLFFVWLRRRVPERWSLAAALFFILVTASPIPWEDVLGGFQSQYYFLIGFSLLGIKWALDCRAFSPQWFLGVFFCGVALITMGSGLLCGPPLVALAGWRLLRGAAPRRDSLATLIAGAVLLAIGLSIYAPVAHHVDLKAHTPGQFLLYLLRCLAWPCPQWPWLAVFLWAPWCLLGFRRVSQRHPPADPATDFLLAAGLWILLQTAAVSYSRGGGSDLPSARYGDVTGLGVFTGFASLALLAGQKRSPRLAFAGVLYFAATAGAIFIAARTVCTETLPSRKGESLDYERNVQAFILTDDPAHLKADHIPFPSPEWLRDFLRNPRIRDLLPPSVRAPVRVVGLDGSDSALFYRRVRQLPPGTQWESPVLTASTRWWKIETKGDLGQPGATLTLVSAKTHETLASIAPTKSAGASWRAAYVRVPPGPVLLRAETGPASTFAFSEPVEVTSLSHLFWNLGKRASWFIATGLVCVAAYLVLRRRFDPLLSTNVAPPPAA